MKRTTMRAREVDAISMADLRFKPVFSLGIVQKYLHELIAPCDAKINGIIIRLPVGCVVSITAGGAGGSLGTLMHDVEFIGRDGEKYRAPRGTAVQFFSA